MNHLIKTALFAASCSLMNLAGAADLTIEVGDVKNDSGTLMVALYTSQDTFLKQPLKGTGARAAAGTNTLVFKNLPEGDYAFAVYHDANANGQMDKNLIGIPTEDYAFSNNAMGKMGPPKFDAAKFSVPAAGATVRVSLK
jgi:uncharacterized protein (DUF2141 family)